MQPRLTMVTLGVADLPRAIVFYRDGLGLEMENDGEGIAMFKLGEVRLSLYSRESLAEDAKVENTPSGGFSGVTLSHNVASKEAVDALLDTARGSGATITKPAEDTFWGGYSGYFADPDGHLWEVAWNPHMPLPE